MIVVSKVCGEVKEKVCDHLGVDPYDIRPASSRGPQQVALARHVAMYVCYHAFGLNHTELGKLFGRDRTTVRHGLDAITYNLKQKRYTTLKKWVDRLIRTYTVE